jgi:TRAP-type C4-dicarboxylate transport system substrate-binding protein
MKAATEYQKEMWAQSTEKSLEIVKEAGVQVIAADKEQFQQSVAPIYEGLRGSELERLVQQIKALGEKM